MAKLKVIGEPEYVLTLSRQEAEILNRLLGNHICGKMEGPRGALEGIWQALNGHTLSSRALSTRDSRALFLLPDGE